MLVLYETLYRDGRTAEIYIPTNNVDCYGKTLVSFFDTDFLGEGGKNNLRNFHIDKSAEQTVVEMFDHGWTFHF